MGHQIYTESFPLNCDKKKVQEHFDSIARHEDYYEGASGLPAPIRWIDDVILDNREAALKWIEENENPWYVQLAVRYREYPNFVPSVKYNKLVYRANELALLTVVTDLFALKARDFDSSIFGVLGTAIFVIALILTFAKDLGKSNSMGLAYAMLAVGVVNSIITFVLYSDILGPTVSAVKSLLMVIIGFLFVIEKYIDKEARGTK